MGQLGSKCVCVCVCVYKWQVWPSVSTCPSVSLLDRYVLFLSHFVRSSVSSLIAFDTPTGIPLVELNCGLPFNCRLSHVCLLCGGAVMYVDVFLCDSKCLYVGKTATHPHVAFHFVNCEPMARLLPLHSIASSPSSLVVSALYPGVLFEYIHTH